MFDERDDLDVDIDPTADVFVNYGGLPYSLSCIVPLLGIERAQTLARALEAAVVGDALPTAYKRLTIVRRFLLVAATQASSEPTWAKLTTDLRSSATSPPSRRCLEEAAQTAFQRLSDGSDDSFCGTDNYRSRQNRWLDLQGALKKLALVKYFPDASFYGKIQYTTGRTPVLADLAHEAGRLGPFVSWEDQELKYLEMNRQMMRELRAALVTRFEEEHRLFIEGRALINLVELDAEEIDGLLSARGKFYGDELGPAGSERRLAVALKLFYAIIYLGYTPSTREGRVNFFFLTAGGKKTLRPYAGATPRALVAALHVVLIDTGWNLQVCADLSDKPFSGGTKRGQRTLRSVASKKIRAGDKLLEAPVADYDLDEDDDQPIQPETTVSLQAKLPGGELSSVQVIEKWLVMTKPLRDRAAAMQDPASKALWIWRGMEGTAPITGLHEITTLWWAAFLKDHGDNHFFGGLSITRRILRKTYGHIHSASGSFLTNLSMALLDQESEATNRLYLSESTIRVRYDTLMRKFMNLWEGVHLGGLEDAARKLGLDPDVIKLRYDLGLASGFDFADISPMRADEVGERKPSPLTLGDGARVFVPRAESLVQLHIARLALTASEDKIATRNPARWGRMWLPWQTITDGIHRKILSSMHSARYRKAIAEAERRLANSEATLPAVW